MILGALATIVSSWGSMFLSRDSWHLYVATRDKLLRLQSRLEFAVAAADGPIELKEVERLFNEYEIIIKEHDERWLKLRGK
jgi:hypothetical protein